MYYINATKMLSVIIAMMMVLTGCFGGGSSGGGEPQDTDGSTNETAVSGVAATGAPLIDATVCVRDVSTSECAATTSTDENGRYEFTEQQLNNVGTPFVIRVEGVDAGGAPTVIHSLASSKEGNIVNVTPLSNSVIAGATNSTDLSEISTEELDLQSVEQIERDLVAILENASILSKLGVESNVELIGDEDYEADRTGIDAFLDLVDIEVYQIQGSDRIGIQITDLGDRTQKLVIERTPNGTMEVNSNQSTFDAALEASNVDLSEVDAPFTSIGSLLSGSPSESELEAYISPQFLDLGMTRSDVVDEIANKRFAFQGATGVASSSDIDGCKNANGGVVCQASVMLTNSDGESLQPFGTTVIETASGWKLWGNQREHDVELQPYAKYSENSATDHGVQFQLIDTPFKSARILSTEGSAKEIFTWTEGDSNFYQMTDAQLDEIESADGHFRIELFNSNDFNGLDLTNVSGTSNAADKVYEDISMDSITFKGDKSMYDRRFPEVSDETNNAIESLGGNVDSLDLSIDVHPTTRIQEMVVTVPTIEGCVYSLNLDGHSLEHERTLDLRDSNIGCPNATFELNKMEVSTVSVDSKGRYYFKGPAY